eukprot:354352_1
MWSRFTRGITPTFSRMTAIASISTCAAASVIMPAKSEDKTVSMTQNRILSDKHHIALASWPIHKNKGHEGVANDDRVKTLNSLIRYVKNAGYDGVECNFTHFKSMYFENSHLSDLQIAQRVRRRFENANLRVFGILSHSQDKYWNTENVDKYLLDLEQNIYLAKQMGGQYVTFQIDLPDKYLYGDGSYRNNQQLLLEFVQRIKVLQEICFEQGMNFYVETHVLRISEDPEAFVKIINYFNEQNGDSFEVNGDLSHFICRGMLHGPFVEQILDNMEHTHVRMSRIYGDLSAEVIDPVKDWNDENGVTKTYWKFTKKGLTNGLSSRVIVGESGPWQLVDDALEQDKKLVPLLRAMADYCDIQVETNEFDTNKFNPFQPTNDNLIDFNLQ